MRWRAAPAWVRAADLSVWMCGHAVGWTAPLSWASMRAAMELREAIALALTFPAQRDLQIRAADTAIVRLRERLRLAQGLNLLDDAQVRHADAELSAIGRMLGGWQRKRRDTEGVDPAAGTA